MSENNYDTEWYKQYENKPGKRKAKGPKQRKISFSWEKHIVSFGQDIKEWEDYKLLRPLMERLKQISQYSAPDALAQQLIKQYTKIGFPLCSNFDEPKHVKPSYWAVIHIKPNSKEVVAGYVENDVYYIVFLDKEHDFWPTNIQERGKTKR